jgi:calcium channel MID1
MRLQYHALQCYLTATISAIFLLFALACDSVAYADTTHAPDAENTLNLRGAIASDGAGFPVGLDSFNGLELRDSVDEDGESNGLDLVRRYPNAAKALGNNQFAAGSLEIGAVEWFYLPKVVVNGKHDVQGAGLPAFVNATDDDDFESLHELRKRDEDLAKREMTTVYLSLTTCSKPHTNKTSSQSGFPQLQVYVSKSAKLQQPGPGEDDSQQEIHTAVGGYVGITKTTDSDVFIGVAAPNSTDYTGDYTYQIAASIDAFFHKVVEDDPNLFFIDADVSAALLVTNNLTQSASNTSNYHQWMNIVPPYTMFAHNINDTALRGLERSFCALDALSQVGRISNSTEVGMTSRGLGNKPKEQFYITGLNQSSSYSGLLAMVGNSTASGNGIIGGGGQVWKPMNFTTKTGKTTIPSQIGNPI